MSELVERARAYATQAHQRIHHQRKYSKQPYQVHLDAVATLVASVTDDPELLAAAWLHDTVEDTPATLDDIEAQFGTQVAELVEELTDVSRPGDGNRVVRKQIDRRHTAQASARAKTVKLADLIDNCKDIVRHDPRFARVYLVEMGALLEVLKEGDPQLLSQARGLHARSLDKLGLVAPDSQAVELWDPMARALPGFAGTAFRQMFTEIFTARDIAESLLSFDADKPCREACKAMEVRRQEVASVRVSGSVQGYMRRSELADGDCGDYLRHFTVDQVVGGRSTLADVIHILTRHDYCFVALLGEVAGLICRDDINKPMVRMWLFGVITMIEMGLVQLIQQQFREDAWQTLISAGRLDKAKAIQAERQRRNQHCALIDCLQLSDKGQILIAYPAMLARLGFDSRSTAKRVVKELESLRNNLAHAQDIATHDWAQIARMTQRIEEIVRS